MMKKTVLDLIQGEGFRSTILKYEDGRVEFTADADIDADGANGQNGARPAYNVSDTGSEYLANGGMHRVGSRVVGTADWWKDIVLEGADGNPLVLEGGVIPSRTSYRFAGKRPNDPSAYVDAETVPYIVVPPSVIQKTAGAVLGCKALATNLQNGRSVECIVADVGPRNKVGELSIAAARALGLPSSPRNGGTEKPIIGYQLWPGVRGSIDGKQIALLRSNGKHIE